MGFFTSLFRGRSDQEREDTQRILECRTAQEREEWFARSRSWLKVSPWLVHEVVTQLSGNPPHRLERFARVAVAARLVPELERIHKIHPSSVACATISGPFCHFGGPLAQKILRKKRRATPSDKHAALARDCLLVALDLYSDPPSAYPLLVMLLARMRQFTDALRLAEVGLSNVQRAIDEAAFRDPDDVIDEFDYAEELRREERELQQLVNALNRLHEATMGDDDRGKTHVGESTSRSPRVLVEYSRDEGKRGPDWMENNVDPILGHYFAPTPTDPVWSHITAENVAAYQLWFQRAVLRAKLYNAHSSESLVGDRAEAVFNTAFQAKEEHGLNLLLVLVLAHQYVEAEAMLRGIHTVDWVAFMMTRNACAPSPESIANFVIDFYGLQSSP